jgi:hypothetical protein
MRIEIELLEKIAVLFLIRIVLPVVGLLYVGDWIKNHQNKMEP